MSNFIRSLMLLVAVENSAKRALRRALRRDEPLLTASALAEDALRRDRTRREFEGLPEDALRDDLRAAAASEMRRRWGR